MTEKYDDKIQKIYSLLVKVSNEVAELKKTVSRLAEAGNGGQ